MCNDFNFKIKDDEIKPSKKQPYKSSSTKEKKFNKNVFIVSILIFIYIIKYLFNFKIESPPKNTKKCLNRNNEVENSNFNNCSENNDTHFNVSVFLNLFFCYQLFKIT